MIIHPKIFLCHASDSCSCLAHELLLLCEASQLKWQSDILAMPGHLSLLSYQDCQPRAVSQQHHGQVTCHCNIITQELFLSDIDPHDAKCSCNWIWASVFQKFCLSVYDQSFYCKFLETCMFPRIERLSETFTMHTKRVH